MKILIVDDSIDKIANILSVINENSTEFQVDSVIDNISAQKKLSEQKYDLLISDLLLPIRENEAPIEDGGFRLIKEIDRNHRIKSPNYIVGLTQYDQHRDKFPDIWNVLTYSSNSDDWKICLVDIIKHIIKAGVHSDIPIPAKKPTIFFEGCTDKIIFREAIRIFYPDLETKIDLKAEKSAGVSWVVRQIVIWAFSLSRGPNGKYIKSVGLLDGDNAGNKGNEEINRIINISSAGSNTFKIFKLSTDYARNLIPLYIKGLNIPITLEEMFPPEYWKVASQKKWLEIRQKPDMLLDDPKKWNKYEMSLQEYLKSLSLSEDEEIYLYKFKNEAKENFCTYITSLEKIEKEAAFLNFKKLIEEISNYLF